MDDRRNFYRNFSIDNSKKEYEKFRHEIKEPISKYENQLEKLIAKVPVWETHFNDRQVSVVKMFLNIKNASLVDDYLKLSKGTSWHALFGENGKGGILGKLNRVYKKLQK